MKIQLLTNPESLNESKNIALSVFEGEALPNFKSVNDFLKENPKFGKNFETQLLFDLKQSNLIVGIGKSEEFNFEICQNFGGVVANYFSNKQNEIVLIPPISDKLSTSDSIYAIALGIYIALHNPAKNYQNKINEQKLSAIQIYLEKVLPEYQGALKKAEIVGEAINLCRTLSDMPGNEMTPSYFMTKAKDLARKNKLKIDIIDEKKALRLGMGGFVGVSRGSDELSYLVTLEYLGDWRSKEKLVLVGKGLTFDSGGISIKPEKGMEEMKYDMSGAAIALSVIQAAAKMKLKINLSIVCPMTENLPSGKSLKPGDIVKLYCGKNAEVISTDAEGRLVLADAVTYAEKDLKATKIIDLATLTGAIIIALGDFYSGTFSNDPEFEKKLVEKGKKVGELFWPMPMDKKFGEQIKSKFADIANLGVGASSTRSGGAITGAKFIEAAILKETPWIHIDLGAPAWDLKSQPFRSPGATGFGIKTLIELITNK